MKASFLFAFAVTFTASALGAEETRHGEPRYTREGELVRPENYREWIFLGAGLGMTYSDSAATKDAAHAPRFDNVFVNPSAYQSFLQTGTWPDHTLFILEVRASGTSASINKGGHYQEGVVGLEAHVKDSARFPNKWAFFQLDPATPSSRPLPANSSCQRCHAAHGAVDETFVQFYPTLVPVAKAKGTFKESAQK